MYDFKIDVAVLFIFFARPEQTQKVFEQIKKARPSKLFLYQDGARINNQNDINGIQECRKIVENIDWKCDVFKWYQDKNVGCDPSEYLAQKWMFSKVDKGIILEDDDVPSQSFFPFCKELLDKYENDLRINMICGMNHMDEVNLDYDYYFSKRGTIWGWATWKRTIDLWDPLYSFLQDPYTTNLLKEQGELTPSILETYRMHIKSNREHYEDFVFSTRMLQSQFCIIPSKNLISNIGIATTSTHTVSSLEHMPPKFRHLYFKKTYEYTFPLKHPKYVVEDVLLTKQMSKTLEYGIKERIFMYKQKLKNIFQFHK